MKNAFTLIELLGVIIIIMILSLLIVPVVTDIIDTSEETVYQSQINKILNSAYDYSLKYTTYLPSSGNTSYITLAQLKIEGLIDTNFVDPTSNKNFDDDLVISIENIGNNESSNSRYSRSKAGYLYTVLIDRLNSASKPQITISGLERNSDGNYIEMLNLNEAYTLPSVSANFLGTDLTSNITKYITSNSKTVSSIDTSKSSIYKVYYIVVSDNGYSNKTILTIIVNDTEKPEIFIPDNNKVSIKENSFDLLSGVSCTDNSGYCDITYSGSITYHTKGKNTITYEATDPSGNTNTVKRIITVE